MTIKSLLSSSSQYSYNTQPALSFCLQISKTIKHLKQTHARILRISSGPHQTHHLLLSLTTQILRFPYHLSYARHVFDQIPHCQNQFLWTSLIRSHSLHAQFSQSLSIYAKMHRSDVPPTAFTFSSVLTACARLPAMKEGQQIHDRVIKSGLSCNKIVQTVLLDMYAKCGVVDEAREVFDAMSERDVVSWTAMVSGYAKVGLMEDARQVFDEMPERNVVSWTAMVAGYANLGDVGAARELFDKMPEKNAVSWTAMIAGYGKCGDVEGARRVFDGAPARDPTSWAAMIACYAQNGFSKEAIETYKEMRGANVDANEVAMVAVISACTQLGDADVADSVAEQMEERCADLTLVAANALVHMHSKCGSIDQACRIFYKMPEKDVISYTALITGLADHGRGQEALEFFERMQKEGITPNQITFVGVLNACSYVGMLDEGCKYFKLMTQTYGIVPLTEHYACMVDLLGRAGELEEAHKLIESMTGAPDAGVWGALLGACRVHCNAKLGEIAAQHLFKIEPENTGNYVLLSNIYASLNRWDEAARVRNMMRERGMMKSPGYSWISRRNASIDVDGTLASIGASLQEPHLRAIAISHFPSSRIITRESLPSRGATPVEKVESKKHGRKAIRSRMQCFLDFWNLNCVLAGNIAPPKPYERAGTSSGPAPFKPPSPGNTSDVVEASGTAKPGEIISTAARSSPVNTNALGRAVPTRPWEQNYGNSLGGYGSSLNKNSGNGSGMYSSYGGFGGGLYGGGLYGNNMYRGQYGNSYGGSGLYGGGLYGNNMYRGQYGNSYGGSGLYGGGMYNSGFGGPMGGYGTGMGTGTGTGTGMGMGGPYGDQDPNNPFGPPPSPPGFWISFLRMMQGVVTFFGRISILIDQNTQAFHLFMSTLLQLFDRSGMLYGELARFVLRLLRVKTKPKMHHQLGPPGALPGPDANGQNYIEGPKAASGSWVTVWTDDGSKGR